jgi:hypothetical protein
MFFQGSVYWKVPLPPSGWDFRLPVRGKYENCDEKKRKNAKEIGKKRK